MLNVTNVSLAASKSRGGLEEGREHQQRGPPEGL